jgi:hypothetical protein
MDEARDVFVNLPTADDPHKRVSLQDAIALLVCEVQDLKTQMAELERWAAVTDELSTGVRKMQQTFDSLAKMLHGTTVQARALMAPKAPGVN